MSLVPQPVTWKAKPALSISHLGVESGEEDAGPGICLFVRFGPGFFTESMLSSSFTMDFRTACGVMQLVRFGLGGRRVRSGRGSCAACGRRRAAL